MKNILSLIGNTPTVRLHRIESELGLSSRLYAKLESYNPSGSTKDRAALWIIKEAMRLGLAREGTSIIEATSGNMGVSLALLSAVLDFRPIIVMPENMSVERVVLIKAYGGEVILTPEKEGMAGATKMAEQLSLGIKDSYTPCQFTNKQGVLAHYESTGPEILTDTEEDMDIFLCGVGTGATLMGVGRYLKEKKPDVQLVAVEPSESAVLSGEVVGSHGIMGIGAGFLPPLLDMEIVDRVVPVSTESALWWSEYLAKKEGIFTGISSGAAVCAAITLAKESENRSKSIAVILPDGGGRYLSVLPRKRWIVDKKREM